MFGPVFGRTGIEQFTLWKEPIAAAFSQSGKDSEGFSVRWAGPFLAEPVETQAPGFHFFGVKAL